MSFPANRLEQKEGVRIGEPRDKANGRQSAAAVGQIQQFGKALFGAGALAHCPVALFIGDSGRAD